MHEHRQNCRTNSANGNICTVSVFSGKLVPSLRKQGEATLRRVDPWRSWTIAGEIFYSPYSKFVHMWELASNQGFLNLSNVKTSFTVVNFMPLPFSSLVKIFTFLYIFIYSASNNCWHRIIEALCQFCKVAVSCNIWSYIWNVCVC